MKSAWFNRKNMRRLFFFFSLTLLFPVVFPLRGEAPKASTEEDPEFVEARRLFWSGQYDESEKQFATYLLQHPNHGASKNFLQMIRQSRIYDRSKISETRKHLENIRLEKLELKDTEWRSVSNYLQDLANPKVGGKDPENYINFINLIPSAFSVKISLDLRDISLMRVIEYACRMAGLRCTVDTWAVIIELPESKK